MHNNVVVAHTSWLIHSGVGCLVASKPAVDLFGGMSLNLKLAILVERKKPHETTTINPFKSTLTDTVLNDSHELCS